MKVSLRDAAFANGMCLYSVGLNDVHKPSGTHPGACVIPVLLAVGEWLNSTGYAFLAAMAAGYEATGRIGRAIAPSHRERGFHPTGTCGTFGATAAAGSLFGFDADQMACAFGIAGSQAAGLYEFHHDGALTMIFHAARAAQNGVEATLLSQEGLTGPATVLEGSKGFALATANTFDTDVITRDLGKRFELDATSFRPYFGCSSTIAACGAMAEIMKRLRPIQTEEVENIVVDCHPVVAKDNAESNPLTLLGARLSLPFNIALVLVHNEVLIGDLEESELWDPRIRNLLPRIQLVPDRDMPRYGSTVMIRFRGGRFEKATVHSPLGDPTTPMSWENVTNKFRRLVKPLIGEKECRKVAEIVAHIEAINISTFLNTLGEVVTRKLGK
jgi:2-methylcitrate dehydratase PrpD